MPATGVQANWTGVQFASSTIKRVTQVRFDRGGQLTEFAGDVDLFPSLLVSLSQRPSASVTSADVAALMTFVGGASGNFQATHKDAAGAAGGDIIYTMTGAVVENVSSDGAHGQLGTATLTLRASAPDGVTNPLTFTRA